MANKALIKSSMMGACLSMIIGCGVRDRAPTNGIVSPVASGNLPAGVWTTKEKKFLVRPSTAGFGVGEQTVVYKIVTSQIDVVTSSDFSIEVKYGMPAMPQMPVTPVKIDFTKPGEIQVVYDISMGGDWECNILFLKNGAEIDRLTYSFNVPD